MASVRASSTLRQRVKGTSASDEGSASADLLPTNARDKGSKQYRRAVSNTINIQLLAVLTLVSAVVRLFQLSHPAQVVFDEVHFGGFASKYVKGKFFMDVHPPLGKLLIAASGVLGGFNGTFTFKEIGMDYVENQVPYVIMRSFPALLGVLLVPIAFVTMRNLGYSNPVSVFTAASLIFENALVCQSRLILLDSFLVTFTALAAMMWTEFLTAQHLPFTFTWWYPLLMTGVSLGLAVSVKWVGLFVIALIGLSTIKNLWDLLGDLQVSMHDFGRHFAARAFALILVPFFVYAFLFQIHFLALPNNGPGSGFMSAEFQSTLRGNEIADTYTDVAFGSKVYIRHHATSGGYLHSHDHYYPTGSKQQQITCYPFRDENNLWTIHYPLQNENGNLTVRPFKSIEYVKNRDIIRLEHVSTEKRLHSHDHRPPITENEDHNEASCYGVEGFTGDTNDHWRIEFDEKNGKELKAINTKFRLVHVNSGCLLFSHAVKLPKWGFEQQEVTCAKNGKRTHATWYIDYNDNKLLPPDSPKVNYVKPGFWRKFAELHSVMWETNEGLTSSHPYDSRPPSWPVLSRGISFWASNKGYKAQIYLIGNPFIWWVASIAIIAFIALSGAALIAEKRGIRFLRTFDLWESSNFGCIYTFGGWILHYVPFFLMSRQLFLHHYLPALYFSVLLTGSVLQLVLLRLHIPLRLQWIIVGGLLLVTAIVFTMFSPLTYGFSMPRAQCERLKWKSSWDWDCAKYDLDSIMPAGQVHEDEIEDEADVTP